MKRKLVTLMALLAGLALAQTRHSTTDSHTVTVNIPSVLQLTLDAEDYLFDFDDTSLTGTETVTVPSSGPGATPYTKASWAAYKNFLETATGTQDFAPTSLTGTGGADYGTVTVFTNRAQWTVKIYSISGSLSFSGSLGSDNNRVKVFAEKVSGKGASWTTTPTPITAPLTLFNAGSGGQGRSVYRLYYLLTMNINDDIPLSGTNNQQITVNLLLTSP
jgi:hypothetical protein